jgi:hypothetical protein
VPCRIWWFSDHCCDKLGRTREKQKLWRISSKCHLMHTFNFSKIIFPMWYRWHAIQTAAVIRSWTWHQAMLETWIVSSGLGKSVTRHKACDSFESQVSWRYDFTFWLNCQHIQDSWPLCTHLISLETLESQSVYKRNLAPLGNWKSTSGTRLEPLTNVCCSYGSFPFSITGMNCMSERPLKNVIPQNRNSIH